jgi:ABC-type dipeptide/oligopeptide/nickel transport system ATPase component
MVIAIIGESCVGKSTLAEELNKKLCGEIITGKDYLRLAKSESTAAAMFREKLSQALTGSHIIYVISEKEHLAFLPEGAIRILVTADLETIKERFKARMRGNLPAAVEAMLEKKHGLFDDIKCDLLYVSDRDDLDNICNEVAGLLS